MNKKYIIIFTSVLVASVVALYFLFGGKNDSETTKIDPEFSRYISAFTSGIISSESTIRIRLTEPYQGAEEGKEITETLFEFRPNIKGTTRWVDAQTIEFTPEAPMIYGQMYNADFLLEELLDVESKFKVFSFQFQILQQHIEVSFDGIDLYDQTQLQWQIVKGTLSTSDVAGLEQLEQVLTAKQGSTSRKIRWTHDENARLHYFEVDSVHRTDEPGALLLEWNGEPIGTQQTGKLEVEVPALGDFKVLQTKVTQQPTQYVSVIFSDPLDAKQNLAGLVAFKNNTTVKTTINSNEILIYPNQRQQGVQIIYLYQGIRNILGYKTKETQELQIRFEDIKPGLELIGKGTIVPSAEGIKFPFRSVNLRAVKVKVIRIFEDNVAQFLQVNQLAGEREIKRVGRVVYQNTVPLTSTKSIDYGQWNTFSLDIDKMIQVEPGAIYRVQLSFGKSESMYPCATENTDETNMESTQEEENWDEGEEEYYYDYDYYGDYEDYYYDDDYDYSQRDNPCHNTYYRYHQTSAARNILASDFGIIAKRGMNNEMTFAVTNLISTTPESGVTLEILNYQQQLINKGSTDGNGLATIEVAKQPYLLVAKKGSQRGYLRLDNGTSLSLSKFDVSGDIVQKGIKGFIYGERGVWRPGDSLYLTFVLEDKQQLLPASHPVSFELINPEGKRTTQMTRTAGVGKFYAFRTATDADAPTGNWSARVSVGGATFQKLIKIETVKPNRLKIKLDFGDEQLTNLEGDMDGKLKVTWLHGAIARGLKATVEVTTKQTKTSFDKFPDYNFDDPARTFDSEEQVIFNERLNQLGEADVNAKIEVNDAAPGMLNAYFKVKVFEEGGDFSVDRFTVPYAPYSSFVGISLPKGDKYTGMLETEKNHEIKIASVQADGKPTAQNEVKVEVYKVEWRWWWERTSNDDLSRYVGSSQHNVIASGFVQTTNGRGTYTLNIPNHHWGRMYIRVTDPASGHTTGQTVYVDWPGWRSRSQKDNPGGATMLMFSADKDKYSVGEKATITMPTGGTGRALVSIETGAKVLQAFWVEATDKNTILDFSITEEMAPNIFVNITLVQPHNSTKNDLPIRMYGVIPLLVEDPQTRLRPIISMADELQPEKKVSIKVSEENGKAMNYTIAMVDEGLLDLTRFKTPDPWSHFYAREALGVKTWDVYDDVMGAYAGQIAGLLAIGGDGEIINKDGGDKANRFKPMVKFIGPFTLNSGESKTHEFTMPQYVGSVRTMVIAGKNNAYGATDKTTPVRQPLMVLATLPRVVGPGESVKLPVTVFAMTSDIKNVSVEVQTNELLPIVGENKKNVSFSSTGDKIVNFDLQIPEKVGKGTLKVIVKSGSHSATHDIEIQVRNPNPPVTDVLEYAIEAGQTWNTNYTLPGMTGTNAAVLEIGSILPLNLEERLQYLIQYPHGCVEQTTSSGFPQLYLGDILQLNETRKQVIRDNIVATIQRLNSFQIPDGGFSYWSGHYYANDWGSSYAGHFLLEAQAKGYAVPQGMIDNWVRYQKRVAQSWTASMPNHNYYYRRDDFVQAYRLYTLALANQPELGAMNRLKEKTDLTREARWRLAAAYKLAGQAQIAESLISTESIDIPNYVEMSYTYGSSDRDRAMIMETLTLMGKRDLATKVLRQLSESLTSKRWMSTQTTAYTLLAVGKYLGTNKTGDGLKYTYTNNGGSGHNIISNAPISQIDLDVKKKQGSVSVKNTSGSVQFARIMMRGIPVAGNEMAATNDLNVSVRYLTMNGLPLDPATITQGTDFKAEVTINNPGYRGVYKELALTQIFPSGWEIHNNRMDETGSVHAKDTPDYMDVRDDRVYYYFNLAEGKSKTFVTLLNASYAGKFYLPAINCEAMYDNTINARTAGKWVQVIKE